MKSENKRLTSIDGKLYNAAKESRRLGFSRWLVAERVRNNCKNPLSPNHQNKGRKNAATKLTEDDVREIKTLLLFSDLNQKEIAAKFNIHCSHVSDIKRKKKWADVELDDVKPKST